MAARPETQVPPVKLYTTAEAAEMLRTSPKRVRELIRAGKLPASRPNGRWLISKADLLECLYRMRHGAAESHEHAALAANQAPEDTDTNGTKDTN